MIAIAVAYYKSSHRNLLEPFYLSLVVFFGMYVTRPLSLASRDPGQYFKGYLLDPYELSAFLLAALGVLSYILAYLISSKLLSFNKSVASSPWDPSRVISACLVIGAISMLLYSIFIRQVGGIANVLAGRGAYSVAALTGSSAYFWSAPLMLFPCGLSLFLMYLQRRRLGYLCLCVALQAPQLVLAVTSGSRIEIMPIGLSYLAAYYLYHQRSLSIKVLLLCSFFVVTVGLNFLVQIRVAGTDARADWFPVLTSTLKSPVAQTKRVFWDGESNDMFESLAVELQVVPRVLPYNPVDFAYRTVAKVIPAAVWTNKPLSPEEHLAAVLFPLESSTTRSSSSPGMIGYSYLFGGIPGVSLIMVFFGILFRWTWCQYLNRPSDLLAIAVASVSLGLVPVIIRGSPSDAMVRLFFIFLPLLFIARFAATGNSKSMSQSNKSKGLST